MAAAVRCTVALRRWLCIGETGRQLGKPLVKGLGISMNGDGSKPWYLVNPKIAGKWMFIPLKMYL